MRVTKKIEEYITNRLREQDPLGYDKESAAYTQEKKALIEKLNEVVDRANEEVLKAIEDAGYKFKDSWFSKPVCLYDSYINKPERADEISKLYHKQNNWIDKKKNEIILELELGGDKDTLMELLNNAINKEE